MSTLTLIGERIAEVGTEFVYHGEAPGCTGCPYRDQCLTLQEGVKYRVVDVREGAQTLDCAVHDLGVRAVEVEPGTVRANVPATNAYAGSTAELAGPCPHTECPSHELCVPDGVDFGDSHRIREIEGDPPHEYCHLDRDLTLVELAPEPE